MDLVKLTAKDGELLDEDRNPVDANLVGEANIEIYSRPITVTHRAFFESDICKRVCEKTPSVADAYTLEEGTSRSISFGWPSVLGRQTEEDDRKKTFDVQYFSLN